VLQEFRHYLADQKVQLSEQDFNANLDFMRNRIRPPLIEFIYGQTEASEIALVNDPLVEKAVEDMAQASELLAKAKRYIASKAQR